MSVVAALSSRLIHVNRRLIGSWRQVYEHGVPVTDLEAVADDGTTARRQTADGRRQTVEFVATVPTGTPPWSPDDLPALLGSWRHLDVELMDDRQGA